MTTRQDLPAGPSPDGLPALSGALRQRILAAVASLCHQELLSSAGEAARKFLKTRGIDEAAIRELNLGLYPGVRRLRDALIAQGFDESVLDREHGIWGCFNGYAMFPWADETGAPLTLYGRWPGKELPEMQRHPGWRAKRRAEYRAWEESDDSGRPVWVEPVVPKMLALPGVKSKRSPFCFDRVLLAGEKELVLVEGVLDAAVAHAHGDHSVIACVSAQLSEDQVATLKGHPPERVTICLDPDGGGERGTRSCVRQLQAAGIPAWVAPPLPDGLDPDDFILKFGLAAWKAHLGRAVLAEQQAPISPLEVESDPSPRIRAGDYGHRLDRRARPYLNKMPFGKEGQGGASRTFAAAVAFVRGFHVNEAEYQAHRDEALAFFDRTFNQRCDPPWPLTDLQRKLDDAATKGRVPWGKLLRTKEGSAEESAPRRERKRPVENGQGQAQPRSHSTRGKVIPPDERRQVVALAGKGFSQVKIAEVLKITRSSVQRILQTAASDRPAPLKMGRPPLGSPEFRVWIYNTLQEFSRMEGKELLRRARKQWGYKGTIRTISDEVERAFDEAEAAQPTSGVSRRQERPSDTPAAAPRGEVPSPPRSAKEETPPSRRRQRPLPPRTQHVADFVRAGRVRRREPGPAAEVVAPALPAETLPLPDDRVDDPESGHLP